MNEYEAKKQARIDRYREKAAKAAKESTGLYQQSHDMLKDIPLAQPLSPALRTYQNRAASKMDRSLEAQEKAAYYASRAFAAENNKAISSDDPEAIEKLKEKLSGLEEKHSFMKKVNAYYRKNQTCHGCEGVSNELETRFETSMENAYSWERAPYPAYKLQNSNQEIRRLKERIAQMEQRQEVGYAGWTFDGGRVEANTDINRLQVFFDAIPPDDVRKEMKAGGFHWSRNEGAWQRQLTDNAIYAARRIPAIRPADGSDPIKIQPKAKKATER